MTAIIFTKWHVYMITAVLSESVSHYELEQAAHLPIATLCKLYIHEHYCTNMRARIVIDQTFCPDTVNSCWQWTWIKVMGY